MANKLDVYQVVLGKNVPHFKNVICQRCAIAQTSTYQVVFNSFYQMLKSQLSPTVYQITEKKIGLTILNPRNAISANVHGYIVEGYIDGGPYDAVRQLTSLTNTTRRQTINRTDIVTDKYYFYMYLPLDSTIGILMVQAKENSSIRRAVKPFFESLFKINKSKNCRIESYFPKWLKEEFIDGAYLSNITFEKENVTQVFAEQELTTEKEVYDVKITFVPKNKTNSVEETQGIMERIKSSFTFSFGRSLYTLENVSKSVTKIKNDEQKKTLPFSVDSDDKIHPIIVLDNCLEADENGEFARDALKQFCANLLERIKPEIYGMEHL